MGRGDATSNIFVRCGKASREFASVTTPELSPLLKTLLYSDPTGLVFIFSLDFSCFDDADTGGSCLISDLNAAPNGESIF